MIFFNGDGEILKTNSILEEMTGYPENDLRGRQIEEFLGEHSEIELKDLKNDPNQHRELNIITKDGKKKTIDVRVTEFEEDTYFAILRDITRHKELAERDPLTKIYNYRKFYDKLEEEMGRSERYGHDLSIIIIDVDNFKKYNDSNGHVTGDKLLKEIASLLEEETRKPDTACRYGGDEFGIILPETGKSEVHKLTGRIKKSYEEVKDDITSLSIGITTFKGKDGPKELVKRADRNMYKNKKDKKP